MSKLFFDLEDVLGGEDYNGTQLEASQVQEFVAWKRKFVDWRGWSPENYNGRDDNALWCLQGSQKLLADTGKCSSDVETESLGQA